MGLLDFLRGKPKAEPPSERVRELADAFSRAFRTEVWVWDWKPADIAECRAILDATPEERAALIPLIVDDTSGVDARWQNENVRTALLSQLLRRKLPLTEQQLIDTARHTGTRSSYGGFDSHIPLLPLIGAIEEHTAANGLSDALRSAVDALLRRVKPHGSTADLRRAASRLEMILGGGAIELPLAIGDLWADAALADYGALSGEERQAWRELFILARSAAAKPSKKWLKEAKALVEQIGIDRFRESMQKWLPLFDRRKDHEVRYVLFIETNIDVLRGLIFCTTFITDPSFPPLVGDTAERSYKKIPNVGPMAPKIGNACVVALSELGTAEATGQLSRLRSRVKNRAAANVIERAFNDAAQRAGLTPDDLEELFVPAFGMTEPGVLRRAIGEITGEVSMDDFSISWLLPNGKRQSSVPAAIKSSAEVKELKKTAAELETMLAAQRARLDNLYLTPRRWSFADWRARYLDHPLVGILARRLIWTFTFDDGSTATALWSDGVMRDAAGADVREPATVALWHPIESSPDAVLAWRKRLEALEITQPFKQAHREIYVITEAELTTSTYSNRFAAHILRQHQFSALCRDRRWRYTLQGAWDSHNTPTRELPAWNLAAEFWVDGAGEDQLSEAGIYLYAVTDQVRFHDGHGNAVPLIDVPPIVFSEVMRNVDLFVGVCSIGNDPTWADRGDAQYAGYWTRYAFGELSGSAATRRAILQSLVPRLKIADRCSVEDKFLVVRGDLRTYKIHLGSSNILMEPNDQYLCIVPNRGAGAPRSEKLYVPFEGDTMLSVIVSKALLLAEDRKITDPTIVAQLARG